LQKEERKMIRTTVLGSVLLFFLFSACCEGATSWGARRDLISSFELFMDNEFDQFENLIDIDMAPVQVSWRPQYGFSLVTRQAIPAGTQVLNIPKKTALHRSIVYETVPLIEILFKEEDIAEETLMAIFFAHMKKKLNLKKPTSLLGAHIGLMFYGEEQPLPSNKQNPEGCGWWEVEGERELAEILEKEWQLIKRKVTRSNLKVDEKGFKRALLVVMARGFTFNIEGDDNLAIIPYLDMFNHDPNGGCSITLYKKGLGDYFEVKTTRDYEKGEQIFIDYGGFANRKLLAEYGFAIENNPQDVIIFTSDALARGSHSSFANEVIDQFTVDRRIMIPRGEEITNRTLSALRLACGLRGYFSSDIVPQHAGDLCEPEDELKFLSLLSLALPTVESFRLFREKMGELAKKHDLIFPLLSAASSPPTTTSDVSPAHLRDITIPFLSTENEICVAEQLLYSAATAYKKEQGHCDDYIFRDNEEGIEDLQVMRDSLAPLEQGKERVSNPEEDDSEKKEHREAKEIQRTEERELYMKFMLLVSNKLKFLRAVESGEKGEEGKEQESDNQE